MTVPMELRTAQRDFDTFLVALRDRAMLQTTHQTYTMLDAVFRVFRRRLTLREFAAFANGLPPLLRAIFVNDWSPEDPVLPFATAAEHAAEVLAVRPDHNLSTPTAIAEVGAALREQLGDSRYVALLEPLSPQARAFWSA